MSRYLPFVLVIGALTAAPIAAAFLYRHRQTQSSRVDSANGKPGAGPPRVRGVATAPVALEEF